ncbi:MAG: polysaccharide biosynthesis/export family protein [Bacteroidales bacterium]|nr:polysaccharide biosynthesis/export family protein [Bacteroidales bacterium]
MGKYFYFFISSIILITGCKVPKDVAYLSDVNIKNQAKEIYEAQKYVSYIAPDDILAITVSSVDPSAVAAFNLPAVTYMEPGEKEMRSTASLQTYLVDNEGYINFPVLGRVKLGGLTKKDAIALLEERISEYVKDPIVSIQFLNYKITVQGEVMKPGEYVLKNERVSILDALGMAGDLTINGERTNILLIRDNNGTIETHRFDITSSELFKSPYYYLKQNDIVYVEPNKARKKNARYSQAEQFNVTVASTLISAVSVITSLVIAVVLK